MANITPITYEQNLSGELSADIDSSTTTITVRHFDSKTGDARTPLSTSLFFTIDKDSSSAENVLASSHSTTGGVTTYLGCTRGVSDSAISVSSGTGEAHGEGATVGHITSHLPLGIISNWQNGTNGSGANILRIGDETATDITIYAQNDQANKPFLRYDETNSKWIFSNDGTSSTDVGGGTGTITAGDGIAITAGVVATDLATDPGLEISTAKLRAKIKTSGGITRDANGLSVNESDLTTFPTKALLTAKGSIYVASGASTPAELAVGTDHETVEYDSAEATGLKTVLRNKLLGISASSTTVAATTTETTFFSFTLPGGLLNGRLLKIKTFVKDRYNGAGETLTIRLKIAGVTIATITITANAAAGYLYGNIEFDVFGTAAAAQTTTYIYDTRLPYWGVTATATQYFAYFISSVTSTENTASDTTITLTAQWGAASASNFFEAKTNIAQILAL